MPRKPRKFEVGGIYHAINRGYEKRQIFFQDDDYKRFIESIQFFNNQNPITIREVRANRGLTPVKRASLVEVLVFVLMPNHYHLILKEIIEGGISLFMQKLSTGYTGYLNTKYDRLGMGGVFQSRYKAIHIENDIQLNTVFSYVHTNPIELKESDWKNLKVKNSKSVIRWLENYRWSSYPDFIGRRNFPDATQRDFFIEFYGGEQMCRKAVEDWVMFKAEKSILDLEILE